MQLGMIGLGRMGGNMVRRLLRAGHQCVAFRNLLEAVRARATSGLADPPETGKSDVAGRFVCNRDADRRW